MRAFDDLAISSKDYENAAKIYNESPKNGIQSFRIDYLICSVARSNNIRIFTTDKDFLNYSKIIELKLHQVRKEI